MSAKEPTLQQWRALYDAAIEIKKLAPWLWMEEIDIFGVQDPESERVGFVSVMGMGGEHFGIAAYIDPLALYQFWTLEEHGDSIDPITLFEIEQLTVSFEDRDMVETEDRAIMKALGLRFRGRRAWPIFRKITPGHLPWFIDAEDARFLTHILEQTSIVAQRMRKDPDLLAVDDDDSIAYLIRTPRQTEQGLVWEDTWQDVPFPDEAMPVALDEDLLAQVQKLPRNPLMVEMEFFPLHHPVADDEGRPFFPYLLMSVDRQSGMVLDFQMYPPKPDYWAMQSQTANFILEAFIRLGGVPQRIYVRNETLGVFLDLLKQRLPIEFLKTSSFRYLDDAVEGLEAFLG